jgi:hypothetical protein
VLGFLVRPFRAANHDARGSALLTDGYAHRTGS